MGRTWRETILAGVRAGNEGGTPSGSSGVSEFLASGGTEHSAILRVAKAEGMDAESKWDFCGAGGAAARCSWLLCAGGALSAGLDSADDGNSSAGCGSEEHSSGVAETAGGSIGRCRDAGRGRILPGGWSTGDCGAGLWDWQYCARGQDCRTRERLRNGGEEVGFV